MPVKLGVALGEGRLWKDIKDEGLKRKHTYTDYMFMVHCDDGFVLFICQYCSHLFCVLYIVLTIFFNKVDKN